MATTTKEVERTRSSISLSVRVTAFDRGGAGGCISWLSRLVAPNPPTDGRGTREDAFELDELGRAEGMETKDGRPPWDELGGTGSTAAASFGGGAGTAAKCGLGTGLLSIGPRVNVSIPQANIRSTDLSR